MFLNVVSKDEGKRFVDMNGTNIGMGVRVITFQQLIGMIQMRV